MRRMHSGTAGRRAPLAVLFLSLLALVPACASTPAWAGLDAEGLFGYGVEQFEERDWDEAIRAFDRLITQHPGFARNDEARMYLARAHFRKGQFIIAAADFERFLQRYPNHGLAPEASLGICRSYVELAPISQRDQTFTERAVEACRTTAIEFQGMNVADEARELQNRMVDRLARREYEDGRFYQRRGLHDSAILVFQDLVDYYPQTVWAPRGYLALYRSYRAIGWEEEAEQARARLLANYPESEAARELRAENGNDLELL
jgi:outer membrane protein assembly factor BamD